MKKRIILFALVILLVFAVGTLHVSASTGNSFSTVTSEAQTRWSAFTGVSTQIDFSGNTGYVSAKATASSSTSQIEGTITVYQKVLIFWVEELTWTRTVSSNTINMSETFTGINGKEYKVVFEATATYNGGSTETVFAQDTAICS